MPFYSDLHIHSRFARATSKKITTAELTKWGILKGLNLIGSGDILHPKWMEEFEATLVFDSNTGFYKPSSEILKTLKQDPEINSLKIPNSTVPSFIPTVETSHIYKDKGRVRRIHLVTIFKDLRKAKIIAKILEDNNVNLKSDGRPIFGMHVKQFLQLLLNALGPENFILIPAHIWTPWYALLGSKSGYDSVQEAFEDLTPYIRALETGLSSDPKMNRQVQSLNDFILVSHSDAHSAPKLGREANIHKQLSNYQDLYSSIMTGTNLIGTIEFYPEEGRYHYDGHRNCQISMNPQQTVKHNGICPVCNKPLTIGVLNRVYQLSALDNETAPQGNKEGQILLQQYKSIYSIPLITIMAEILGVKPTSKKAYSQYIHTIKKLGPELKILHELQGSEIAKHNSILACAINLMRQGEIVVKPGFDGEYGIVKLDLFKCTQTRTSQPPLPII